MSRYEESIPRLTEREFQILQLVSLGKTAKEIAIKLVIAPSTVERHIENARLKTRTKNRTHMIAFVLTEGLVTFNH